MYLLQCEFKGLDDVRITTRAPPDHLHLDLIHDLPSPFLHYLPCHRRRFFSAGHGRLAKNGTWWVAAGMRSGWAWVNDSMRRNAAIPGLQGRSPHNQL